MGLETVLFCCLIEGSAIMPGTCVGSQARKAVLEGLLRFFPTLTLVTPRAILRSGGLGMRCSMRSTSSACGQPLYPTSARSRCSFRAALLGDRWSQSLLSGRWPANWGRASGTRSRIGDRLPGVWPAKAEGTITDRIAGSGEALRTLGL